MDAALSDNPKSSESLEATLSLEATPSLEPRCTFMLFISVLLPS